MKTLVIKFGGTSVGTIKKIKKAADVKDEKGIVPDWAYVAPGEGDFDYVNYLKLMHDNNYDGFITIEISFQVQANPQYNPLDTAKNSYRILDNAFKEANIIRNNS